MKIVDITLRVVLPWRQDSYLAVCNLLLQPIGKMGISPPRVYSDCGTLPRLRQMYQVPIER